MGKAHTVTFRTQGFRESGRGDTSADLPRFDQTGGVSGPPARYATGWLHTTHPDTGQPVVFQAGELLPDWAPDPED